MAIGSLVIGKMSFQFQNNFVLFLTCIAVGVILSWITGASEYKNELVALENIGGADVSPHQRIRIMCILLTSPKNYESRTIHVKNTWGKRCDKLVFASTKEDRDLGALGLNETEDYNHLWGKVKKSMEYAYDNYYDQFDWFFKGDDDTYAFMDNMRYMLSEYSPDDPIYFGHKFKTHSHRYGYFSGGSGYVMSREALKRFTQQAMKNSSLCKTDNTGAEDWQMGSCMDNVGVLAGDSRDKFNRERFLPFRAYSHLFSHRTNWYWDRKYYDTDEGVDCCSNYVVSFHYTAVRSMYLMDYLVYDAQVYGIKHIFNDTLRVQPFSKVANELNYQAEHIQLQSE